MRRFIKGSIYAVILISLLAIPVMAAFSSTITVTESSNTDYEKIGVTLDKDVDYLADHGFISTSGRDVRITQGVTELDFMLVDDRLNFVLGVSGNTTQTAVFTTDNTPQDYQIVPGYEGKITVSDDAALELGNDFELEFTDTWIDTDASASKYLYNKQNAAQVYVSSGVDGDITAGITEIGDYTFELSTANGNLGSSYNTRQGQRIDSFPSDTIVSVQFYMNKNGTPTGTATARVRKVSDDSVLGELGTLDVSTLTGSTTWVTFDDTSVTGCNGIDIYVAVEYSGGDAGNFVNVRWGDPSGIDKNVAYYNGSWFENATYDATIRLYYVSGTTTVTASGVSSGEHDITVEQDDNSGAGWLGTWSNRIELTVDSSKIDSNLTHFPLLIKLSTSSGIGSDDVTGANYLKLAVTEDDGTTELYVEVEKWDDTGEEAWLWTSLSTTVIDSSTDTTLYLYYDSTHADNTSYVGATNSTPAENVWDANYVAVYHMADGADTSHIYDSTDNNNDGTKAGANEPIEATGIYGYEQDFDGNDDEIDIPTATVSGMEEKGTILIWAKADWSSLGESDVRLISSDHTSGINYEFRTYSALNIGFHMGNGSEIISANAFPSSLPTDNAFTLTNYKWYESGSKYYVEAGHDGEWLDTSSASDNSLVMPDANLYIGHWSSNYFTGTIGEVRISNIARSDAWIKAAYYASSDNLITYEDYSAEGAPHTQYIYDLSLTVDSTLEDRTLGASVPDNANDIILMDNSTTDFMPYMGRFQYTVDDTLLINYKPNAIISGTTLPDREGTAQNGTFTYGSNPAGIAVSMSGLVSDYSVDVSSELGISEILPSAHETPIAPEDAANQKLQDLTLYGYSGHSFYS